MTKFSGVHFEAMTIRRNLTAIECDYSTKENSTAEYVEIIFADRIAQMRNALDAIEKRVQETVAFSDALFDVAEKGMTNATALQA